MGLKIVLFFMCEWVYGSFAFLFLSSSSFLVDAFDGQVSFAGGFVVDCRTIYNVSFGNEMFIIMVSVYVTLAFMAIFCRSQS